MGSNFEAPKEEKQPQKREGLLFEIKKRLGKFDISVGIERGNEPAKAKIDLNNNKIDARVSPEGVRKGLELAQEFLNRPDVAKKMEGWTEKLKEVSRKMKEKTAKEKLKAYAKQEGKTEAEALKDLLG